MKNIKIENLVTEKVLTWKAIDALIELVDLYGRASMREVLNKLRQHESNVIDEIEIETEKEGNAMKTKEEKANLNFMQEALKSVSVNKLYRLWAIAPNQSTEERLTKAEVLRRYEKQMRNAPTTRIADGSPTGRVAPSYSDEDVNRYLSYGVDNALEMLLKN